MIVNELNDEWQALAHMRSPWEKYHRDIADYVMPHTQGYDQLYGSQSLGAIQQAMATPVASEKAKNLYDMTSLWAVQRLAAGVLSLKTPETEMWQDLSTDSLFGQEPTHDEKLFLERLRNYLFKVRHNPKTGFWNAHRATIISMCAFGDGWMFIEENAGSARVPFHYEHRPLAELYPGVGSDGQPNRMFTVMAWTALQLAVRFGEKVGSKVIDMANDPKKRHNRIRLMHGIMPREDGKKIGVGVQAAQYQSHYSLPEDKIHIGEGGYFEFPYVRYSWNNSGRTPYSEGPVAFALGEIKSLNVMAKNELLSADMMLRPPLGTVGKNFTRINFNPGAVTPGMVSPEGRLLFAPLNNGARPDFASVIMQPRREALREMLYLNLWQILLNDQRDTATAALIKAQEKGELLGPVGISMNEGLSMMNDREVGILTRKGAFRDGSPLAAPDSMNKADVVPVYRSPLDRLRRMGELVGIQRLIEIVTGLEQIKPGAALRLDEDNIMDVAQDILGAPITVLRKAADAQAARDQLAQSQQAAAGAETMRMGGEAARAIGEGGMAAAQGAEAVTQTPALQRLLSSMNQLQAAA